VIARLVRFYYDADDEVRTACFEGMAYEDFDLADADAHEEQLKLKRIDYIRTDL
jgi:hypothetical protein